MSKKTIPLKIEFEDPIVTPQAFAEPVGAFDSPVARKMGRPKTVSRDPASKRIAVTLGPEEFKRVAMRCIELEIDRQTFLERAIALYMEETDPQKHI